MYKMPGCFVFVVFLNLIFLIAACDTNDLSSRNSNRTFYAGNDLAARVAHKIQWGNLNKTEIKKDVENKQIIDTLKFLLLYDDMLNKKYNPSEYQEVYQRKISYDEIEKKEEQKKYDNQMVNELLAIDKNIKKNSLCIFFNNIHIGEYDSEKNGFPIYEEPWNYSAGMPKKLYYGKVGKIVLTNTKDNVFPKFLACDKKLAKSVLDEFKYIEVGIFPTHRERVCCAYVGFIPQRATIEKDESNEEVKVIYGKGNDFVLFTTEEGSIIRISLSGDKWKQE